MIYFLGYILTNIIIFTAFFLFIFGIKNLAIFTYCKIKNYFFPTPAIPEEIYDQVLNEALEFVHSVHRPWGYDDLFAEFLNVSGEMLNNKWEELYGK